MLKVLSARKWIVRIRRKNERQFHPARAKNTARVFYESNPMNLNYTKLVSASKSQFESRNLGMSRKLINTRLIVKINIVE